MVMALGLFMLVVWMSPELQFRLSSPATVALHTFFESASIIAAVMVFSVGWYCIGKTGTNAVELAAILFCSVAILDFLHLLVYQGMPVFLPHSSLDQAITLFLAARLLAALAILSIAIIPAQMKFEHAARRAVLISSTLFAVGVGVVSLLFPHLLPIYLVPGAGLTETKIWSEYFIIGLNIAAVLAFLARMRNRQPYPIVTLCVAAAVMALSELFFTLYATTNDQFIHLAHVYKVIAYALIYRAIFIENIRFPFEQLRQSEANLLRSHARYELAAVSAAIWERRFSDAEDPGRASILLSPRFKQLLGYDDADLPAEISAQMWDEIVHPEDRPRIAQKLRSLCVGHESCEAELRLRTKDGNYRWFRSNGQACFDNSGKLDRMAGMIEDITARKAAKDRLAAIIDQSMDAIISVDADQRIVVFNAAAEKLFLTPADQAMGQPLARFIPERFHESHDAKMREFMSSGVAVRAMGQFSQVSAISSDGREFPIEASISHVRTDNQALFTVTMRDITARTQADAVRNQLAAIVENSNDAIFSRTLDGTMLSWNSGAEKMLGYAASEVIGKKSNFMTPPGRPPGRTKTNEKILRDEVALHESDRLTKDGRVIPVFSSHSLIRDAAGNIVGVSVILQDMTQLKQAEAARFALEVQLRESQKMEAVGTLAGGIAHDFNNIIAAILGNAELARQDAIGSPALLESLDEISKAGRRGRDLVQQILSFSRREPTERKPILLSSVVEESVRLLRATLPARLSLQVQCDPDVPAVLVDATQIEQVIINLATNAMQAMRGMPGSIEIRLDTVMLDAAMAEANPALRTLYQKHPGRTARLTVKDTGPGMNAETLKRIFEPFFTTKPVNEGTGLGLAVVHGIVERHEGAIQADSVPGKGAAFAMYLPLAAVAHGVPEAGQGNTATPIALGRQILYLDDDEALVFLVKRLLERRGYRVSAQTDQNEALAVLRADPAAFDLVVTDYNMPGISGLDVAREVRLIRDDLPVAVASGFIDEDLRSQAAGAGVREMIFKANAVEDFCDVVQRLIEGAGNPS